MSFVIGDRVELDPAQVNNFQSIAYSKIYRVVYVSRNARFIRLTNDRGDDVNYRAALFIKFIPAPMTNPHGQRITSPQGTFKAQYQHDAKELQAVDEEDYDTRKANRSVTSAGLFKVGTRLIYEDGTPTLTSLTVKRCTATSVWFEETYSTPFNPNEFITER